MVNKIFKPLLVLAFIVLSTDLFAQNSPPCPSQPCQPPGRSIDGGLVVLLAIGIGYGIKKVRDSEK